MIGASIVQYTDLQTMCRPGGPPPKAATVQRWAVGQGIKFKADGQGGIWTTVEALNQALGVIPLPDEPRFEDLI